MLVVRAGLLTGNVVKQLGKVPGELASFHFWNLEQSTFTFGIQRRKSGHSTNLSYALSEGRNHPAPHGPWRGAKFRVYVLAGFLPHVNRPRFCGRGRVGSQYMIFLVVESTVALNSCCMIEIPEIPEKFSMDFFFFS